MLTQLPLSAMVATLPQALVHDLPSGTCDGIWAAATCVLALGTALAGPLLLAVAIALALQRLPPDSWAGALDRKISVICLASFALLGTLCGSLAVAACQEHGQVAALSLGVAATAFLSAALVTAGQTLRR